MSTRGGQRLLMIRSRVCLVLSLWVIVLPVAIAAQTPGQSALPQPLTLEEAIHYAADHYPTLKAALEQVTASAGGGDVARSAYPPRLDSLWQSNRATTNNIFGQVLPQSVIPALTGPVLAATSAESVWGSAARGLLSCVTRDFRLGTTHAR